MHDSFSTIVKEALETSPDGFGEVVEEATKLLYKEKGNMSNFEVLGRLIKLKPVGEALIVGDLHGDLESLVDIMKESGFQEKLEENADASLIFLGDYGDRGAYSAEIYYTVLKFKLLYPEQVLLLRGNHELFWAQDGSEEVGPSPHDLPMQLQARFGEEWTEPYAKIRELFKCLYTAVLVEERYLLVHGGLPSQAATIEDFAFAHSACQENSFLEDLLWSDPDETGGETYPSPRGAGKLFGKAVTNRVLEKLGVKILVRGHEPCEEGYKINHDGKVLTLFSRKGPPYFNSHGAYLQVELSRKFENAEQLIPFIHKF
ncbi:MAG TPA: metallophosphoesterase family protein [Candidatus Bathyarchaeia archaeon]|nr:metallophosphoesterase family protein [Candidatus Bathyarchaeia archaeon]